MPATLDKAEQVLAEISRLVYKFEVDEESLQATQRRVRESEEERQKTVENYRELEKAKFEASAELRHKRELEHFDNLKRQLERYWAERLEMVQKGSDQEVQITERRNADLQRLDEQRKTYELQSTMQQDAARGGMGGGFFGTGTLQDVIRGLGGTSLLGLGSVAGITAALYQSITTLREAAVQAREVAHIAGIDPTFAYGLEPTFLELQRRYAIPKETIGRVAATFAPVVPGGDPTTSGQAVGDWTERALMIGRGAGVDPQTIARFMTQVELLERSGLPGMNRQLERALNTARSLGVPAGQFVDWLSNMVQTGRLYNQSISESTTMLTLFAGELQQGRISLQELQQLQKAGAKTPEGFQAVIGAEILRSGGPVADWLRSIGATDPYFAAAAMRVTLEGGLVTREGILGPHDQTATQQQEVRRHRELIEHEMGRYVEDTAGGMLGRDAQGWQRDFMTARMARTMMGFPGETIANQVRGFDYFMDRATPSAVGDALPPITLAGLMREGQESAREAMTWYQKIWQGVLGVSDSVTMTGKALEAVLRGDFEAANRWWGMADTQRAINRERMTGRWTPETNTYWPLPPGFEDQMKLIIENKSNQNLEFKLQNENPKGTSSAMSPAGGGGGAR